jgi:putative ABC transport system permease protein
MRRVNIRLHPEQGVDASRAISRELSGGLGTLFPVFEVSDETAGLAVGCGAAVGVLAALFAARQAVRVPIVVGLRGMG